MAGSQPLAKSSLPASKSDEKAAHLRVEFESLQRQSHDISSRPCFQPGGRLHQIDFMANAHSVHVARWLKVLAHTPAQVTVATANPLPAFNGNFVSARPLLPRFLKLPMTLRYFLSGLVARGSNSRRDRVVHAHSASGNGLIAWLSGRPYVIGIYGSEVFDAKRRGPLYCWLLKKVLHGAARLSAASPECAQLLVQDFGIPADRIHLLYLGYDANVFYPLTPRQRQQRRSDVQLPTDEPIWTVIRRTHPLYRTSEVVEGFLAYAAAHNQGRLVLLCGDCDPGYLHTIDQRVKSHPQGHRIVVIDRMLTPPEFATWVQLGDFSISVPKTDNFSLAIRESLGCGTIPVLSALDGYSPLRECQAVRWVENYEPHDFAAMFADTSNTWADLGESDRTECLRFAHENYSSEKSIQEIIEFYLGRESPECHQPTERCRDSHVPDNATLCELGIS